MNVTGSGGGMYISDAVMTIEESIIANNGSKSGGGMFVSAMADVSMNRCVVRGNESGTAAVLYLNDTAGKLENCILSGNTSSDDFSLAIQAQANIDVVNCTFSN
jgi:hypothetical protein